MQWVNFAIFITDFEILIFANKFIHMLLLSETIVANRKFIKDMNLFVFIRFKFELFQVFNFIC